MSKITYLFIFIASILIAKTPTFEQMASQMILVGFAGDNVQDKWVGQIAKEIKSQRVGGVIFFQKNISIPKKLKELTSYLQKENSSKYPLFISIDQEGGFVQRLNKQNGFNEFPSAKEIASHFTLSQAEKKYGELSKELEIYGFNLNFAPVVDLDINQESPAIGAKQRSYSSKEEIVEAYSAVFIDELHKHHVKSVLKHFPGHGSATTDTHKTFTDITKTWDFKELKPYYDFIKYDKVDMVMIGHLHNSAFDVHYPATLSKVMVTNILREKLGYKGVVISDDMQMDAISKNYGMKEAIIKSINAGVDILLFSNYFYENSNIVKFFHTTLKEALKSGAITKKRIEESYERIIELKKSMRKK